MSQPVLDRLLDEDLATDPVTAGGLSNHRPMALIALAALGADDDRLVTLATEYGARLQPCREHISRRTAELGDELDRQGTAAVLHRLVPELAAGVGGAAFHGLIRLGYGLEHGRSADVAGGLAYLIDAAQPIPCAPRPTTSTYDLPALLTRLRDDPTLRDRTFASSGFSARFDEVGADAGFLDHLAGLAPDAGDLATLASSSHALYRSTGNFFALHTMTATHAARLVTEHLTDESDARALAVGLTHAIAAAYVVIGTPPIEPTPAAAAPPSWADITGAARRSDDPHVLKMVHTCQQEQAAWGGLDHQITAAQVSGLPER